MNRIYSLLLVQGLYAGMVGGKGLFGRGNDHLSRK